MLEECITKTKFQDGHQAINVGVILPKLKSRTASGLE